MWSLGATGEATLADLSTTKGVTTALAFISPIEIGSARASPWDATQDADTSTTTTTNGGEDFVDGKVSVVGTKAEDVVIGDARGDAGDANAGPAGGDGGADDGDGSGTAGAGEYISSSFLCIFSSREDVAPMIMEVENICDLGWDSCGAGESWRCRAYTLGTHTWKNTKSYHESL
jgi:hypothetical protein